ncbi:MAG: short-chain dehydrogenase [Novosphingobium sp. 28-62-57]|uniref:SDR family NAD(P)-dependent oxidoreductase n=1 Tax=unclassified Novosphingobium TaxID=2644732 RepID=UPI000BD686DE|nr:MULTISPECIES: SDR family NAD(P)-dependent oxidoreductase [unclassified Novosphingobium]OYW51333.1 MAG: short-chain dehydrogenase [Novosphingobium sp. 12-62-10]OYZ40720.1 MAG: short-chain dehydrogenase [Novosphingobium sp. 16-62-11]OZA40339.1 MAG: short-chain dehydrogenase [Novosphingobium sp. 17-62-9]OYZ10530.1 MAG: short-chain dehydrogenase [Novosphingobium sp. 28-62-57]HQS67998.1 SDR family NAD(P)-dependent oxidoreductase [Novosphingobium sp.]
MARDTQVFNAGTAVITGAGSGIGAGLARRAGALGMHVVVTDINEAAAAQTASAITAAGGSAEAERVDVSIPEELDRLAELVFARHGEVRLLINNAGIETVGNTWEVSASRWEATLNINVHGVIHGVRAFVPRIIASGKEAWIGNLSSVGAFGQMPGQTAYTVTKHAVQAFSECLYLEMELKGLPIHVSAIVPGLMRTNIFNAETSAGEPGNASSHRRAMFEMMRDHGMDIDEGCRLFLEQMAEGKFWAHSHPDMSEQIIGGRIRFLQEQIPPIMPDLARQIAVE